MFKMQSLFILQNDAQGFHSVDHFGNEILRHFSLDAAWVLFGSSEGSESANDQTNRHITTTKEKLNVGGKTVSEIKAAFWFACDASQTILQCRT